MTKKIHSACLKFTHVMQSTILNLDDQVSNLKGLFKCKSLTECFNNQSSQEHTIEVNTLYQFSAPSNPLNYLC